MSASGKTRDVTQFQEQSHGADRADAGNSFQQLHLGSVGFCGGEFAEQPGLLLDQFAQVIVFCQQVFETLLLVRIRKTNGFEPVHESYGLRVAGAGKREAKATQLAFYLVLFSHPVADQLPAAADHLAVRQLLRAF